MFTEAEHRLIIELAASTASHLAAVLQDTSQPPGQGHYWHMFDSSFTRPCAVLWQLGVAFGCGESGRDIPWPERRFPGAFRFLDDRRLRGRLQDRRSLPLIDLDELLGCWLNLAHGHASPPLPVARHPFEMTRCAAVMAALTNGGYADRVENRFQWTPRIAPAMEAFWLWEHDGTPSAEKDDAIAELHASQMLSQADAELVGRLTARAKATGELEFVTWLRDDMDGLFIDFRADGTVSPLRGVERIRMLKRVHARLRETRH